MKSRPAGKRRYWLTLGAEALVLLILLFVWVIPAHSKAVQAQKDWDDQVKELEALQKAVKVKKIPSVAALESLRDYREWLKGQDQVIKDFFADRSSVLEAPITGQGETTAVDFKESYVEAVKTQGKWLQDRLGFSDPTKAFATYSWTEGVGAPKPEEYVAVLRGYWTRVILYDVFLDPAVRVSSVKKLDVGDAVSLTPEFDALPVRMDVTLSPENVARLLETLLAVSPATSERPVINLTRMSLSPGPMDTQPLCSLQLDLDILLLRSGLPEKKAEAPKR